MLDCFNCPYKQYENNISELSIRNSLPKKAQVCLGCSLFNNIYINHNILQASDIANQVINFVNNGTLTLQDKNNMGCKFIVNCIFDISQRIAFINGPNSFENVLKHIIDDLKEEAILSLFPDGIIKDSIEYVNTIKSTIENITSDQNKTYDTVLVSAKILKLLCKYCYKYQVSLIG